MLMLASVVSINQILLAVALLACAVVMVLVGLLWRLHHKFRSLKHWQHDCKQLNDRLLASEEMLRQTNEMARVGGWEYIQGQEHVTWSDGTAMIHEVEPGTQVPIDQAIRFYAPEDRQKVRDNLQQCIEKGEPYDLVMTLITAKGDRRIVHSIGRPRIRDGQIVGAYGTFQDITEQHQSQTQLELTTRELQHRVKNMLNNILAMCEQTLASSRSPEDFAEAFRGRLQAMSRAFDLLDQGHWEAVELQSLIETIRLIYGDNDDKRISFTGDSVQLGADLTFPIAMALHELCSNANKYGALGLPGGRITVIGRVIHISGQRTLRLSWKETGGPHVQTPVRESVGMRLIRDGLTYQTDGQVEIHYEPDGLLCLITVPLRH